MTKNHKDQLTRILEILTIVGLSGGIVGGGTAWAWNSIISPKVQREINSAIDKYEKSQLNKFDKMEILLLDVRERTIRIESKLEIRHIEKRRSRDLMYTN